MDIRQDRSGRFVQYFTVCLAFGAAIFCLASSSIGQLLNNPIQASGRWHSAFNGEGAWTASLRMEGNTLSGSMQLEGREDAQAGQLIGHFSGGSIQLGVISAGDARADFSGSLTADGVAGTYQTSAGDRGEWSGSWRGDAPQLASNDWPPDAPSPIPQRPGLPRPLPSQRRSGARQFESRQIESTWWKRWSAQVAHAQVVGANQLANAILDNGLPQNEPEIAVDWATPGSNRMVAGANDYSFGGQVSLGAYISNDGGANWSFRQNLPVSGYNRGADPSLDFDTQGRAFFAGLAYNSPSGGVCGDVNHAVVVSRLDSGSNTWNSPPTVVSSTAAGSGREIDRPWLAVDRSPQSPNRDNVYAAWTKIAGAGCATAYIQVARSTNNGQAFDTPDVVSDDVDGVDSWPNMAVDINGDVNIVWIDENEVINFDKCVNVALGLSCGTDLPIVAINPPNNPLPGTSFTMSWSPQMAVNVRTVGTQTYGYIYIVWNHWNPTPSPGHSDIYFTRSIDGGNTFATPVPIAHTNLDEFFPTISIDAGSFIQVVYYRRTGVADRFNVYAISSGNAGQVWSSPVQLNDGGDIQPVDFNGEFIGDYIGVDGGFSGSNKTVAVWMNSRRNQQDIYSALWGC